MTAKKKKRNNKDDVQQLNLLNNTVNETEKKENTVLRKKPKVLHYGLGKKNNKEPFDLLYKAAFWGSALLLFIPPYFRGLFFAPDQEKALLFATLIFGLTFLWRWLKQDYKFLRSSLDWFALILPIVYIISSFTAVNKGLAINEIVKNVLYFMTYWSVSRLVRNKDDIHKLLHVLYISALGVAMAGMAASTGIIHIKDGFLNERIYSTFQYPNALASYLGAATLLGVYLWSRSCDYLLGKCISSQYTGPPKWMASYNFWCYLYACGNLILLAVLIGTGSRGGLLTFAFVFVIWLMGVGAKNRLKTTLHLGFNGLIAAIIASKFINHAANEQPWQAWLWVIGGLFVALIWQTTYTVAERKFTIMWEENLRKYNQAFVAIFITGIAVVGVLLSANVSVLEKIPDFSNLKTAFQRINYIGTAWEMILNRPMLGWGGGGWREAYQGFMDYNYTTREVHSYYFQVGVETGFTGLLAVGGIWLSFMYMALRVFRSSKNQSNLSLVWVLISAFLLISGHALIDFDLSLSALTMVLWSLYGIMSGLAATVTANSLDDKKNVPPNYMPIGVATVVLLLVLTLNSLLVQSYAYANQGFALLRSQQGAGIKYVEKAVAYNPYNSGLRVTLSQLYRGIGQKEKAMVEAQRAVELSRYDIGPRSNMIETALVLDKPDIALRELSKTFALAPNNISVYQNAANFYVRLGQAALQKGNKQEARGYFEECLRVADIMETHWNGLSETSLEMWRGPKLIMNRPMQLSLGKTLFWMGELDTAKNLLGQAAKDGNKAVKGEALLYLAMVSEKQGQVERSKQYLDRVKQVAPGVENNYGTLFSVGTL